MNEYVMNVCKFGQGAETCKYLLAASEGWQCARLTGDKATIDRIWAEDSTKIAQADHWCEKCIRGIAEGRG